MWKHNLVSFNYDKEQMTEPRQDGKGDTKTAGKNSLKGMTREGLEKSMQKACKGALGTIYSIQSQPTLTKSPAEPEALVEPLQTLIREHQQVFKEPMALPQAGIKITLSH